MNQATTRRHPARPDDFPLSGAHDHLKTSLVTVAISATRVSLLDGFEPARAIELSKFTAQVNSDVRGNRKAPESSLHAIAATCRPTWLFGSCQVHPVCLTDALYERRYPLPVVNTDARIESMLRWLRR